MVFWPFARTKYFTFHKKSYAWEKINPSHHPGDGIHIVTHGGDGIMLWRCSSKEETEEAVRANEKVNENKYRKILVENLLEAVEAEVYIQVKKIILKTIVARATI